MNPRARRPNSHTQPTAAAPSVSQRAAAERALRHAHAVFPLPKPPTVEWKRYPVTAGRAYPMENRICLSALLLTSEERVRETLLHEYAHLVVYHRFGRKPRPHGEEWKRVMTALGVSPERTHNYAPLPTSKPRRTLIYRCARCGEEIPRVRPLKRGRAYYHVKCGGSVRLNRRLQ